MPRTIHRCNTPDGPRYREWSSIVDAYTTAPMTRDEMVDYLTSDAIEKARREADERLFRADHRGTSQYDDTRSMDAWDTERCVLPHRRAPFRAVSDPAFRR